MFSHKIRDRLQNVDDPAVMKSIVQDLSPDSCYRLRFKTGDTSKDLYAQHPLFSYRCRPSMAAKEKESGGQAAAAESDGKPSKPTDPPEEVHYKHFMNDILLIDMSREEAEDLQHAMIKEKGFRPGRLVAIDSLKKLRFYSRPTDKTPIPIKIKDFHGVVVASTQTIEKQRTEKHLHRLLFQLNDLK